jgi:hypothetical protein
MFSDQNTQKIEYIMYPGIMRCNGGIGEYK